MLSVKARLSAASHERIAVGVEAARSGPFGLFVDGGDVQNVRIIFDEILQQARHCGACAGSFTLSIQPVSGEHLALAEKLFAEVLLELKGFAGERTGDFALLHALGVLQLFFAEFQHLAVIKPERRDADEQ